MCEPRRFGIAGPGRPARAETAIRSRSHEPDSEAIPGWDSVCGRFWWRLATKGRSFSARESPERAVCGSLMRGNGAIPSFFRLDPSWRAVQIRVAPIRPTARTGDSGQATKATVAIMTISNSMCVNRCRRSWPRPRWWARSIQATNRRADGSGRRRGTGG